jgi:AraC-like DNA-binding protein
MSLGSLGLVEERPTRVLRHESEHGAWELVVARPDSRLRGVIHGLQGYVETGQPSGMRQEVPYTRVPLILNFGAPWRLSRSATSADSDRRESFVAGLHETSTFVTPEGPATCMQVDLTPIGAHLVLGVPMRELANLTVDADELLGANRDLVPRLVEESSWDARFALVESAIAARIRDARPPAAEVVWAWHTIERTNGAVRVTTLAERIGRSRRHLLALFREHVGLGPKTFARLVRFNHAVSLLRSGRSRSFAELAHECGYFDQAHLIRDFREFAATTPAELAGRVIPGGGVKVP